MTGSAVHCDGVEDRVGSVGVPSRSEVQGGGIFDECPRNGHHMGVSVSNEDGKFDVVMSFLGLSGPLTKVGFEGHSVRPAGRQVASGARGSSSANAHPGGRAGDWNHC